MRPAGIFRGKRGVLFAWLLSYLLILCIPLVITILTYTQTVSILENEIADSNLVLLRRVRERLDDLADEARRLSVEIALNPRFDAFVRGSDLKAPKNPEIYAVARDFRLYRTFYVSIDDFYVYLAEPDAVLSSAGLVGARFFYDTYVRSLGVPFEAWYAELRARHQGDFLALDAGADQSSDALLYMQSLPLLGGLSFASNAVISLKRSRFIEGVADAAGLKSASILIIDSRGKIVAASAGSQRLPAVDYAILPAGEGIFHFADEGLKYIGSSAASRIAAWKYVIAVPQGVFWEKAESARNLSLFGFGLCLLAGAAMVIVALKRNYDPLGELVNYLEEFRARIPDSAENEFGFIRRAVDEARREHEKYGVILAQQNRVLRDNFLVRLAKGAVPAGALFQDELYLHGISFPSELFMVLAFYVSDFSDSFPGEAAGRKGTELFDQFRKVTMVMQTVVEELLNERNTGFAFEMDGMLTGLVCLSPRARERARREIDELVEKAQTTLMDRFHIHFSAAASSPHRGPEGIPHAYAEALQTMEMNKVLGLEDVNHFEDLGGLKRANYQYPPETERRLINVVKSGDFEQARALVLDVFERNFGGAILPLSQARCLMFDLAGTMIKTAEELGALYRADLVDSTGPIERLLACRTIQEMKEVCLATLESFCSAVGREESSSAQSRKRRAARKIAEEVSAYVQESFADPGLDIGALARRFELHPIYLSRLFHEQTGRGLLDFINHARIEKAKSFMRASPEAAIEEVGAAVGYSSSRTFTRAFKKHEGITPGRYKTAGLKS